MNTSKAQIGWFRRLLRNTFRLVVILGISLAIFVGWNYYKWRDISALQDFASMDELGVMISDIVEDENVPGLAVSIVADGQVVWSDGFGFANIATQLPVTPDTPFLIGSVSKIYTGIGVMQAVEAGHLALDADINTYLPFGVENPKIEGETITLRNLATHTSGIVNNVKTSNGAHVIGDTAVSLAEYLEDNLNADGKSYDAEKNFTPTTPGSSFSYSNAGLSLAGGLVGAATGTPLDVYTQASIFDALEMHNTGWHLSDFADQSKIATPYNQSFWFWVIGEEYVKGNPRSQEKTAFGTRGFEQTTSPSYPMGGLRSSVNDQGKFLAAIMNGGELDGVRIIKTETLNTMFTPQITNVEINDGEVETQGLFWARDFDGYWGHTGGGIGANNIIFFDRETNFGGVISLNLGATLKSLAVRQRVLHQIMNHQDKIRAMIAN
jgi:CubicO group peptidase (beta-lactamase class C family)